MSWLQRIFIALLLTFLSIVSVTGTIALRNVLHLALLLMLLVYGVQHFSSERVRFVALGKAVPISVVLWCSYLLLFPLFAPDGRGALANLLGKGMWGESILTWVLAWGAILVLGANQLGLWSLALVSAVPVFIHLVLLVFAWSGFLQPAFYTDPTLETAVSSLFAVLNDPHLVQDAFSAFPMGFRGIEPMHGNLGYPASQATCLALAVGFSAWQKRERTRLIKATALIVACFLSVVIAQSRASAYFSLLLVLLALVLHFWIHRGKNQRAAMLQDASWGWKSMVITFGLLAASVLLFVQVASTQLVWYSMGDKMALGFRMENPKALLCEGLPSDLPEQIRQMFPKASAEYVQALAEGLRGDGARVLMGRAGIELVQEYPWGLNGGREAYQIRMSQSCNHVPAMNYSHAHNAWVNLALSVGVVGACIFAWVLLTFFQMGMRLMQQDVESTHGMLLCLIALFWILRGIFDAVYQEHYLQMQAFFLLYVGLIALKNDTLLNSTE